MFPKSKFFLFGLVTLLTLLLVPLASPRIGAAETQDLDFEVFACGDQSGYNEETYVVARTEAEWIAVWQRHTRPFFDDQTPPEVDFAEKMLICTFMGEQSTAGYSIRVDRVWVEEERIHVEIEKSAPRKDSVVAQVITYPYTFVLLDTSEMEVVFHIPGEGGNEDVLITPEFTGPALALFGLLVLSVVIIALRQLGKI